MVNTKNHVSTESKKVVKKGCPRGGGANAGVRASKKKNREKERECFWGNTGGKNTWGEQSTKKNKKTERERAGTKKTAIVKGGGHKKPKGNPAGEKEVTSKTQNHGLFVS